MRADHERWSSAAWTVWLLAAGIILLLAGMPLPLTDGVTALYGKIAKNILASGSWLTLHHSTMPVVDKPPLTFWLMSLSMTAFGTAEWGLRAWHTALAAGTLGATYALARLALPPQQAALSALILLTSMQFFYQSLVPEQHIPLALFVTLAVYWYLRWEEKGGLRAAALAGLAVALAVLSIGLAGLLMPVLIVGARLLVDRPPLPRRAVPEAAFAALVLLLVAAPWFVIGAARQGAPFVNTFFLGGTLGVGRFFRQVQAAPTVVPWWAGLWAYALLVPLGFLPWTGWLWPALREGWAARRARERVPWVCTLWALAVLGFLSLSPGDKASRYILPVLPPLAVLAGRVVGRADLARPAAVVSLAAALPLLGLVMVVPFWKFPAESARYSLLFWTFIPTLAAGLAAYALAAFRGRPRTGIVLLAAMTLVSYGLAMTALARIWDQISPWRPLARTINQIQAAGAQPAGGRARVLIQGSFNELADYYITGPVEFLNRDGIIDAWRRGPVLAVVPRRDLPALPDVPAPAIVMTAPDDLVLVGNFPPPRDGVHGDRAPDAPGERGPSAAARP